MRNERSVALILVALVTLATVGLGVQSLPLVEAQVESELVVEDSVVGVGEVETVGIDLSSAPNGLTGYNITI
jgi:hypothetical protein